MNKQELRESGKNGFLCLTINTGDGPTWFILDEKKFRDSIVDPIDFEVETESWDGTHAEISYEPYDEAMISGVICGAEMSGDKMSKKDAKAYLDDHLAKYGVLNNEMESN